MPRHAHPRVTACSVASLDLPGGASICCTNPVLRHAARLHGRRRLRCADPRRTQKLGRHTSCISNEDRQSIGNQTAFSTGCLHVPTPCRVTWPPSRWCGDRPAHALPGRCPKHPAPAAGRYWRPQARAARTGAWGRRGGPAGAGHGCTIIRAISIQFADMGESS